MLDLLVITFLVTLIVAWFQSRPFFWRGKSIQWKTPLPMIGNTGGLLVKPWHQFWTQFYRGMGEHRITGFHFFSSPALVLKDPVLLKKVMISDAHHFGEREFHKDEIDPIGRSLFFVGNQEWKSQRAKMTPYFTPLRIKAMMPYLHPITDTFVDVIAEKSSKGPIDTRTVSLQLATDVIISNVFGLKPEAFENPDSFFYNLQRELLSFDTGLRGVLGILSPSLYRLFGLTFFRPSTIAKLTGFVTEVISQRSKGTGVRPDFMQGMMELLDENQTVSPQQNGINGFGKHQKLDDSYEKFDRKTVVGQCMLLYVAGTETTGSTMGFLMFELALNQIVQDKMRSEINTMLRDTKQQYGVEDLHRLQYTHQVISETLRKYPVATVVGRKCTENYNLDGLELPVGTIISVPIIAIHHDPKFYPQPNKFDPERFSTASQIIPGTYLPFGLGPRTCIGMKFALTELLLALCKLIPKYRLVPCSRTPQAVEFNNNLTLSSKIPLWVSVEPVI